MEKKKKYGFWEIIQIVEVVFFLLFLFVGLPLIIQRGMGCSSETDTSLGIVVSLSCNYGFWGIMGVVALLVIYLILIKIVNSSRKK